MAIIPSGMATAIDMVRAADDAIVRGDHHAARRLLAALAGMLAEGESDLTQAE